MRIRISIKWKMTAAYTLIILGVLVFFSWLVLNALENYYIDSREKNYLAHANIIGGTGREMLLTGDRNAFYVAKNYGENVNARVLLLNQEGKVIMDSFGEDWLEGLALGHSEVNSALSGESSTGIHLINKEKRVLYVAVPVINNGEIKGAVMMVTGLEDIYSTLEQVRDRVILLSLLCGLMAMVSSFFISGYLTRPVKELISGVEKMSRGNLNVRVPVHGKDEMGQLAAAFNIMSSKLEGIEKARKEFIANVSHEFKSPLGSIKALAQSLLHSNEKNPEVYREFLSDIDLEIDRLSRLANELMYLIRLEEEGVKVHREEVIISKVVKHVLGILYTQANDKNISLNADVDEGLSWRVDYDLLVRILFNLVDNAIKYSPENDGTVLIDAKKENEELVIRVQDNGEGIPQEDLPYLFDRFYRVDKARSRETGGSGLGLAIVWQAAKMQNGTVEVETSMKGTIFKVNLPQA